MKELLKLRSPRIILGEIIQSKAADNEVKLARNRKMEIVFHMTGIRRNLCLPMPNSAL